MRIRASDYHEITQVQGLESTADGELLTYVEETPKDSRSYEYTLKNVDADGNTVTVVADGDGKYSEPRWSSDDQSLAYVESTSERPDRIRLFHRLKNESETLAFGIGQIHSLSWAPGGTKLAFVQSVTPAEMENERDVDPDETDERHEPDPRVIDRMIYRTGTEYLDGRWSQVYVVDIDDGTIERVTDGAEHHRQPDWGDAETLYYIRENPEREDDQEQKTILGHDIVADEATEIAVTYDRSPSPAATSDGTVAYRFSPNGHPNPKWYSSDIRLVDAETGETVTVTEDLSRRIHRDSPVRWGPNEQYVYFLVPNEGSVQIHKTSRHNDVTCLTGSEDDHVHEFAVGDNRIAYTKSRWNYPVDVYVSDIDGDQRTRIASPNYEYLDDRTVSEPCELWVDGDEFDLQGWVLTPPNFEEDGSYPLIVNVHGGPTTMWTTSGSMWHEFQTLAARGYVVCWCNPRGSTGYGEDFTLDLPLSDGNVYLDDVLRFTATVTSREYVDEENVFLTGGSYGGYVTALALGVSDRFAAAVPQRGLYDRIAQYGAKDTYYKLENEIGIPWHNVETYWETSPISRVEGMNTPTLILHSERDYRVPIQNAETFYRFLRRKGVTARFVRYPREGHGLSRGGEPAHVVDRIERIARWFDGYSDHHDVPLAIDRGDEGLTRSDSR